MRSREDEDLRTIVPEDEHVHVALQVIRPPTVEFTIHVVYAPDGEIWNLVLEKTAGPLESVLRPS